MGTSLLLEARLNWNGPGASGFGCYSKTKAQEQADEARKAAVEFSWAPVAYDDTPVKRESKKPAVVDAEFSDLAPEARRLECGVDLQ